MQLRSFLCLRLLSLLILVGGIGLLIASIKSSEKVFIYIAPVIIFSGIITQFSTAFSYNKTIIEVRLNESDICLNRPGNTNANSTVIYYDNISHVSYIAKETPITHKLITSITLNTNTESIVINNIENAEKCTEMIKYRISNGSFENYHDEDEEDPTI